MKITKKQNLILNQKKNKSTYPSCTGPMAFPVRDSSVINALVIDSVGFKPPSCYKFTKMKIRTNTMTKDCI